VPTKNPRLSVVLPPSLAATLADLAHETGDSASSLVRGLLEQTEPALLRMLELVRAAKLAKGQIGSGVSQTMDRVVGDLQDALAVAESRTGRVAQDLAALNQAGAKSRRRAGGGTGAAGAAGSSARGSTPVPVTRGSGTGKTRRSNGRKGGRHGAL
jgi:hypothetical protein